MKIRKLKEVRAAVLAHPDQFDMSMWFVGDLIINGQSQEAGGCGTAACFGGWAIHLEKQRLKKSKSLAYTNHILAGDSGYIYDNAARLLGLDDIKASRLFQLEDWPTEFRKGYVKAKTVEARAKVAARRVDHFIKTGK